MAQNPVLSIFITLIIIILLLKNVISIVILLEAPALGDAAFLLFQTLPSAATERAQNLGTKRGHPCILVLGSQKGL